MLKYIISLFIIALITPGLDAQQRRNNARADNTNLKWWTESKAVTYTSKSFDANVGKTNFMVIQFCATFSKDCEALAPEYNKLAEMYTGANPKRSDMIISKIDGWTFNSLSQTYSVKKFPTIRFFNKGDASSSDEYSGELKADKISEWAENLIRTKTGGSAEQSKPEEPKKEEVREAPREEVKQPETTNTQQAQTNNAEPAKPATPATPATPEPPREVKVVLETHLLQTQFDEVQRQFNTLKEHFERTIADNFKKVESLSQAVENHKTDSRTLIDNLSRQLSTSINTHKDEIKNHFNSHTETYSSGLKETLNSIKSKVYEKKVEEPTGPGFMHNLLYMIIGGAIGGVAVFFLASGGNKKRRSMLD